MKTRLLILLATSLLVAYGAGAATPVAVIVQSEGEVTVRGAGVLIADGVVLVPAQLIDQGDEYFVVDPSTDDRLSASLKDRSVRLVLLSVPDLTGIATSMATVAPTPGASVRLALPDRTFRDGVLASMSPADSVNVGGYEFTMTVNDDETGAPVRNSCDALVSIVTGSAGPDSIGLSITHNELAAFMTEHGVSFSEAPEPCPSLEEQLRVAEQTASGLEAAQQALRAQIDSLEGERAHSETRQAELSERIALRDSIIQQVPALQASVDSTPAPEAQRQMGEVAEPDSRSQRRFTPGWGAALLVFCILAVGMMIWVLLHRHRQRKQEELNAPTDQLQGVQGHTAWGQIQGRRASQQDAADCIEWATNCYLMILADGIGGHRGGDVASRTVVDRFRESFLANDEDNLRKRLIGALTDANDTLALAKQESPHLDDMGTTLVGATIEDSRLSWVSVGDSPLWLIRDGSAMQLNENHSMGHTLVSAVMGEDIDLVDAPHTAESLQPGDVLIAASDGVETCSLDELAAIGTAHKPSAADIAVAILNAVEAHERGFQDNATLIVYCAK